MQRMFRGAAIALALAGLANAASARSIVPAEKHFWSYDGTLPACDSADVLDRMSTRFQQSEHEYWNSPLEIVSYDKISTIALRPWGLDHIPRNFCRARALFNDRSTRTIAYSVVEDQGIIGMGFGVEWCVEGLDREYAYGPACRSEMP